MNKFPTQLAAAVYRVTELFPENEPLRYKIREIAVEILADFAVFQDLETQGAETEQGFSRKNQLKNQIFSKIEILNNYYFDLAREQAWVHPLNFLILKREYDKMKSDIETRLSQIKLPASTEGLRRGKPEPKPEPKPKPEPEPEPEPEQIIEPEQPSEPASEPELPKIIEPEIYRAPRSVNFEPEQKKLSARHQEILKIIEQGGKKQVGEIRKSFPSLSKRTLRRDLEFLLNQGYVERLGQWNEVSYRIKT
jgi:hypothetical protein